MPATVPPFPSGLLRLSSPAQTLSNTTGHTGQTAGGNSSLARSRHRLFVPSPMNACNPQVSPLSAPIISYAEGEEEREEEDGDREANLLPLLSPGAQAQVDHLSPDRPYLPGQPKSLAGIALRAFCLGVALGLALLLTLATLLWTSSPLWRLPFFLAALSTFHFLEFWTTAAYNTRNADVKSFLLTANWPAYAIAHAAASLECLIVGVLWPRRSWAPPHTGALVTAAGLALVVVGQAVRSAAMVQAGASFNHVVQQRRARQHTLVTSGVYAHLRHPSYFGFFWWGLGTQIVMGNVLCFVAYAAVLWRFFSSRIRREEQLLVQFFGDEYVDYRRKTGTKIPFVP